MKWATGQSCIRKEVTYYKIHTLVEETPFDLYIQVRNSKTHMTKTALNA
jgi:hypothetical protein